jgi:hypothetical protein
MKQAQAALTEMKSSLKFHSFSQFIDLIIMATEYSVQINGEQHEFLYLLISELIETGQTTVVEARNTGMWLNTFGNARDY